MAIRYAVATGNWSAPATWNGGTLPTSADDVYSNNFTVTIDTTPIIVSSINNTSVASPVVTLGGKFVPTDGITLTCTATNGVGSPVQTGNCFVSSLITGQSCTIVANVNTATYTPPGVVVNAGVGTLYFRGSVVSQGTDGGITLANASSGVLDVTGNLSASSNCRAIYQFGGGTVNFTGSCTGGNSGALTNSTIGNGGSGTVIVTGTCSGGSATTALNNAGTGTILVYGPIIASNATPGLISPSASANIVLSGPFLTSTNGTHAIFCARWFWANANVIPTRYEIRTANLTTIRPLYTADSVGGNPATSNVRLGTIYGPVSELTGTCAIPAISAVATGVPVDNTLGTGYFGITPADFWDTPITSIEGSVVSGSIGKKLAAASTASLLGTYIASFENKSNN